MAAASFSALKKPRFIQQYYPSIAMRQHQHRLEDRVRKSREIVVRSRQLVQQTKVRVEQSRALLAQKQRLVGAT